MPTLLNNAIVDISYEMKNTRTSNEDRLQLYENKILNMLYGTIMDVEQWYRDLYKEQYDAEVDTRKNGLAICKSIWQALEPHLKTLIEDCPDDKKKHPRFSLSVELEDNGRYTVTILNRNHSPYSDYTVELQFHCEKLPYSLYTVTRLNNQKVEFVVWDHEVRKSVVLEKPNIFVYRDDTIGMEEHIVYSSVKHKAMLRVNITVKGEVKAGELKIISEND